MEAFDKLVAIYSKIREVNDEPNEGEAASESHVRAAFQSVGLQPDSTLERLYLLHNGIYHLDAFLHFLSVEDAIACYTNFAKFKDDWPDFKWEPSWFPIFDLNGDVQICIDLDSGRIMTIHIECDSVRLIAPHYNAYIDALFEIFSRGQYNYQPASGSIEIDDAVWSDVASRYGIVALGDV